MSFQVSGEEKENSELKKVKKIEHVKNIIEANSDSLLAKENADLRRRLELASNFLLKKKEKIEKNTPVFEAQTNQNYALKYRMISLSNQTLTYLPKINLRGNTSSLALKTVSDTSKNTAGCFRNGSLL